MKDPAGGVCEEEAEEEGGRREEERSPRGGGGGPGYPRASCHLLGEGPHLCLFSLWRRDVGIKALRMVDSAEKRSLFLEQLTALELEDGNREARRRGQDGGDPDGPKAGPRKPRFAAEAASREARGGRPRSAPETAPARFPGLRRGPRAEGAGARAGTATPGGGGEADRRLATATAAGKSGPVLSVRTPGLPAAPRPRPRRPARAFGR
uniref:translation initiation factor IF-2-like isoform X1 n=1 Tax=Halichoerus grypus TaxID=9711 RepID=UPI001658D83A|nr:translation initiation factor IF-2-like isoform X1 [Halichoerus grypus]